MFLSEEDQVAAVNFWMKLFDKIQILLTQSASQYPDITVHNGGTIYIIPDLGPREADLGCEPVLLLVDVEPQSVDAEPELNGSERNIE